MIFQTSPRRSDTQSGLASRMREMDTFLVVLILLVEISGARYIISTKTLLQFAKVRWM